MAAEQEADGNRRALAKRARAKGPLNSMGEPFAGETWSCARCGKSGPDDDTRDLPPCLPRAGVVAAMAYHELAFGPPAHARRLAAKARMHALTVTRG